MADDRPLVLTAELDEKTFDWLDGLRRRHFPPERNHLSAHLTLFHALPGDQHGRVCAELADVTAARTAIEGSAARWMPLGSGVAMAIEAPALSALRGELARRLADVLTRQDAGGFRPHVTVQNKVSPARARELRAQLEKEHAPRAVMIPGLWLWRYDGGPWQPERHFSFARE